MTKRTSKAAPSAKTIAQLQETLLRAALLSQALPGSSFPTRLSDLHFILRHPEIYLLKENLAGKISVKGLPKPLRVVTKAEIEELAGNQENVAYLTFQPPSIEGETVRIVLEGKLSTADPAQHSLGLSSVQAVFRKEGNNWISPDPPIALAG